MPDRNARRVKALRGKRPVPQDKKTEPVEKDVYGADARSELAYRPYGMFDGVDAHRPMYFGFRPNEERR